MKVVLAQINTTVGDFAGNRRRILDGYRRAHEARADAVVFPELAITGYPPLDLLTRSEFVEAAFGSLDRLVAELNGPVAAVVGAIRPAPAGARRPLHNSAVVIERGRIMAEHHKTLLPTYDVFDEGRYFEPGPGATVWEWRGRRVGLAVCEDLWGGAPSFVDARYACDLVAELARARVALVLSPSASPYHRYKPRQREAVFLQNAARIGAPLFVCNLVGGNTELIFDGASMAASPAGILARGARFAEDWVLIDDAGAGAGVAAPTGNGGSEAGDSDDVDALASALVLGIRDFFTKTGFERAVLGLSGGIDSAVAAVVACEALGPARVRGIAMPSRYSSPGSLTDARELARRLGMEITEVSIEPLFEAYLATLGRYFGAPVAGVTAENLQARIRGMLLMAVSNRSGELVLATGNKSELAVGYCTLYGDMNGALAPLGDVVKRDIYALARLPRYRALVPEPSITKPPSAELRENQTDQDTLPPYELLDPIVELYLERQATQEAIVADGFPKQVVAEVASLIERSEHKREQAPPILRVTPKAFGIGRRVPIARRWDSTSQP